MSELYWLTDEQMVRLQPYFPKSHGKPPGDDRQVLSGIVFVNRNRLRWCDASSAHGPHKPVSSAVERTLYNRWKRWGKRSTRLFDKRKNAPSRTQVGVPRRRPSALVRAANLKRVRLKRWCRLQDRTCAPRIAKASEEQKVANQNMSLSHKMRLCSATTHPHPNLCRGCVSTSGF